MSEMREYQQKMLNSKSEIVFCNWERGKGKTYSIFKKMLEDKNRKYIYVSSNRTKALRDCFTEYINEERNSIKHFKDSGNEISIHFYNGDLLQVFIGSINSFTDKLRGLNDIEYAFLDECYPNEEIVKFVKEMGAKQLYYMITNDNIEYIDSKYENDGLYDWLNLADTENLNKFIDASIMKLINEFSNIPQTERTTITRNNILDMIEKLQRIKNK